MSTHDDLFELLKQFLPTGRALLIVGAGFSWGAKISDGCAIPGVKRMTDILLQEAGEDPNANNGFDLATAVQAYRSTEPDESKVAALFWSLFNATDLAQHHMKIAERPWFRVYTTNYDNVFELAADKIEQALEVFDYTGLVRPPSSSITQVVHLHGYIKSTNPSDDPNRFIAGVASYAQPTLYQSDWLRQLERDVEHSPLVLVVGNSLKDSHVARLLSKRPEYFEKIHFIVEPDPPRALDFQLSSFGNVHKIGVDALGELCGKVTTSRVQQSELPSGLEAMNFELPKSSPTSKDLDDLLLRGRIDRALVQQQMFDAKAIRYFVERTQGVVREIERRRANVVFAHSNIGNGKTLFATELAGRLAQKGYVPFILHSERGSISAALHYLSTLPHQVCLVVEDVFQHDDLLRDVGNVKRSGMIQILTSRTPVYEIRAQSIRRDYGGRALEVELNQLSHDEVRATSQLLDQFGYWKDLAVMSQEQRAHHIATRCRAEMRSILLSLLDSPTIRERLNSFFRELKSLPGRVVEFIVISSYARLIAGVDLSAYDLEDIMKFDYSREIRTVRGDLSDELFTVGLETKFKTSVFGEYFIREFFEDEEVISHIDRFITGLDAACDKSDRFRPMLRQALRYRYIRSVLNSSRAAELVDVFFDGLHNIRTAQRDPLFWVQASIAKAGVQNFEKSFDYVATARGVAKRRLGFDVYQIDTHEARILVESRLNGFSHDYGDALKRSVNLIDGVMSRRDEDLVHPLDVVVTYWDYYSRFKDDITDATTAQIVNALKRIRARLEHYPKGILERNKVGERSRQSIDALLHVAKSYC